MLESTKISALESAARIAGLATIAGGLACQPKQTPPEVPAPAVSPTPAETAPEVPAATDNVEQNEGFKAPENFPENFDSCKTVLTSATKDLNNFSFEKIPENIQTCCAEYTNFLAANRKMSGEFHGFCCDVQNWQGSAACTPWGPPTPPAFPA